MKTDARYFNFPINLLIGFMEKDKTSKCLNNICDYAIYAYSLTIGLSNENERIGIACNYFCLSLGNTEKSIRNGKSLYHSNTGSKVMTGINVKVWFDYYKNEKTDFEKICLLGHLAIKSILQSKPYLKIDNKFWFSRIAGFNNSVDVDKFPCNILKFLNEYQTKKIKNELSYNWGLKTFSKHNRGFYVSYKLPLEKLVYEAEKRRKITKEKQHKKLINEAIKKAREQLGL